MLYFGAMLAPLFALILSAAPPMGPTVKAGPVQAHLLVSETAGLFHFVDQLSAWSPYSHKQYRQFLEGEGQGGLSKADLEVLERYAQVRRRLGIGPLEQVLYVDGAWEQALLAAVKAKRLSQADADVVKEALAHFAPRVLPEINARAQDVRAYAQRVQATLKNEAAFLRAASAFFSVKAVEVPIVIVASPGKGFGGGGFNGGRLVVEVGEGAQGAGPLLHELWHAFAEPRKQVLVSAAGKTPGLDFETLSEGFAYAASPGLWAMDARAGDELQAKVRSHLQERRSFLNDPYVRFNRFGLALRPVLEAGLRAGTLKLEAALPVALAQFRGLHALAEAQERTPRGFFVFGTGHGELSMTIAQAGHDVWARDLQPRQLEPLAPRIRPTDVVVLVLPSSDAEAVPVEFRTLAGGGWQDVAKAMRSAASGRVRVQGKTAPVAVYWGGAQPAGGNAEPAWLAGTEP